MSNRLKKALVWVILLSTALTISSCKTTKETAYIQIPTLQVDAVVRPVLEAIPDMDVTGFTDLQIDNLMEVITAYNTDLLMLSTYAEQLEGILQIQTDYMNEVVRILNVPP